MPTSQSLGDRPRVCQVEVRAKLLLPFLLLVTETGLSGEVGVT